MRIQFLGAAGTVTGSKYLVETDSATFLLDCGLFQGQKSLRERNWKGPEFNVSALDGIVLTHAHIDHSGYLPVLVQHGFNAPIYCTSATARLLQLLLPDSAHLQEEEARYAAKHNTSRHSPPKPLYTIEDAQRVLKLVTVFERDTPQQLFPGVYIDARVAGHILGAVSIGVESGGRRVLFSGDIGRYGSPILPDPQPNTIGDALICESTYGDRIHADADTKSELAAVISRAVDRRGPLLIPAFAVGRTQTLLYEIAELEREGRIPELPVFVDSPMAVDATELYREFHFDFDDEAKTIMRAGARPLATAHTIFCKTVEDSKRLNGREGPCVIISASGMVNGGRIMHHMKNWLPKEETTVLFVGFQAVGTRGRLIESGAKDVKIFGQYVPIRANIESISGLSAHGDREELLRWLRSCGGSPSIVRIVHGEPEASRAFSRSLREEFSWDAIPALHKETIEV